MRYLIIIVVQTMGVLIFAGDFPSSDIPSLKNLSQIIVLGQTLQNPQSVSTVQSIIQEELNNNTPFSPVQSDSPKTVNLKKSFPGKLKEQLLLQQEKEKKEAEKATSPRIRKKTSGSIVVSPSGSPLTAALSIKSSQQYNITLNNGVGKPDDLNLLPEENDPKKLYKPRISRLKIEPVHYEGTESNTDN